MTSTMGPRDATSPRGSYEDGESGNRRMFDKRTLRRMYRTHFNAAIHTFRDAKAHHTLQHALPPSGTAVFLRKRPLFEREAEDFDIVTSLAKGGHGDTGSMYPPMRLSCWVCTTRRPITATVLHDCKLKADLKTPYIVHRTFPLPCFSEAMTNDDVCTGINLPRVRTSKSAIHVVIMYTPITTLVAFQQLLQRAVDGEHITCCMFGQTGSGKSHTMAGTCCVCMW